MAYFDIKPLLKEYNPQYTLIYGQRSNGKSWSIKEEAVKRFMDSGDTFMYIRRYEQDLKSGGAKEYWDDFIHDPAGLKKWTKGKYVDMDFRSGEIYMIKPGKKREKVLFGYYAALSTYERLKSRAFPKVTLICFEEFLTKRIYLEDEYSKLQSIVSTCARNRIINVCLIGNTESRVCPYFEEMGVPEVYKMADGTQQLFHQHNHRGDQVDILCVHCPEVDNSEVDGKSMFFGRSAKMILSGEWDVNEYPCRPRDMKSECVYEMSIDFTTFRFIMQLCIDKDNEQPFVFLIPNKNNRVLDRVISQDMDINPMVSNSWNERIKPEMLLKDLWHRSKVYYSDLLTANDFNSCLINADIVL